MILADVNFAKFAKDIVAIFTWEDGVLKPLYTTGNVGKQSTIDSCVIVEKNNQKSLRFFKLYLGKIFYIELVSLGKCFTI